MTRKTPSNLKSPLQKQKNIPISQKSHNSSHKQNNIKKKNPQQKSFFFIETSNLDLGVQEQILKEKKKF